MKNSIIIALLFVNISFSQAQGISGLKPLTINWLNGVQVVQLKQAKTEGVLLTDSISLQVTFLNKDYARFNSDSNNFEVRWFYYMATKKQLMDSYFQKAVLINTLPDANYMLQTARTNLRKGWWEVHVIFKGDNGLVQLDNISTFQVFIK